MVVPIDWARGMGLEQGDQVEIWYNGELRVKPKKKPKTKDGTTEIVYV
jgi:bifunctional DNA-binding transcriptional regulator/antitoxin component of YhaV-PrlF toxin-antitoxin module